MTVLPKSPRYLETAYSADDIGPNGVPMPPGLSPVASASPAVETAPATHNGTHNDAHKLAPKKANTRQSFAFVDEKPVSPESTEALLGAVDKVFRVVTARIAFHEREAKKLREALAPFAGLSGPHTEAPVAAPLTSESLIQQLAELANQLPEAES